MTTRETKINAPLIMVSGQKHPATHDRWSVDLVPRDACRADEGCITCGDVAVVLTVTSVDGSDANCIDLTGRHEWVAVELVGEVQPGDRLLVHAGVALELIDPVPDPMTEG